MTQRDTLQEQMLEQTYVTEKTIKEGLHIWTMLTLSTMETVFDMAGYNLRSSQEMLATYHRLYQDGLRTWQKYLRNFAETLAHAIRDSYAHTNGVVRH